ncbi:DUF2860 domain-containing protein [Photobacterium sp. SDRW27]|uniref:DUF2860 domain-containing protein n=1 Tax=Photobacterium obscurum TaxID=2829490 RepID=UPI0022435114|nr:DUF2860 domain-containing protein [Photobacterium obscurum]MCW8328403.1 DUF2860 domain-containing protein [Photobacterium obscurum]
MRYVSLLALGTVVIPSAFAIEPIPKESGVSGFFNLGAGITSVESNLLAKFGSVDIGNKAIDSLTQTPDTRTVGIPVIGLELAYTFASTRTQVFLGNQLEDYVRFDFSTRAGIRQEIGNAGIIGASFLQTPLPTEVWEDPFLTGAERSKTDRTSDGYRLIWDNIYGTDLELRYSAREIDIDRERSGEALGLSDSDRALLNRNGDSTRFAALYTFKRDGMKHLITPAIAYFEQDSDGNAMAYDGLAFSVNYIYSMDNRWRFVTNASYANIEFNEDNPVFGTKADGERYGLSFTTFYAQPFGWKGWLANAGVVWFEENSDINFYDSSVGLINAGMLYRF